MHAGMRSKRALLASTTLIGVLGMALAGPAPGLLPGRKTIRLVGRGMCSQTLLQDPPCGGGDIALKLGSNNKLPCTIWQLAAVKPADPGQNLVGVPVTIQSACRMAPNPTCNAFLTGPTTCSDGYTNMGAGGQWVIEAVGAKYRLRSLKWIPAGTGAENITQGDADHISSAYDGVNLGPLFAATDSYTLEGAVYYSTEETVCAQQGGSGRRLLGSAACRRRRSLSGQTGWVMYLGQKFGDADGSISLQVDPSGLPAVAFRNTGGKGILRVSNGTNWQFGCTSDGKFANKVQSVSLAITPPEMMSDVGMQQVVAYADGDNNGTLVVKYCNAGQWEQFNGTAFDHPVSDINLGMWPWDMGNGTDSWTPVVGFINLDSNLPVARYYNWSSNDWESLTAMPTQGTISDLKVRFSLLGVIPLVTYADNGLGGQGSLLIPNFAKRRRLLSASGAASVASVQSALSSYWGYNFNWTHLPPGQSNFTAGPASNFDLALVGGQAIVIAYRDATQGGKLSAAIITGGPVVLGQSGITPGAASQTALSASYYLGTASDWVYCAFRDDSMTPHTMSVYKLNVKDWLKWYQQTRP
ncbi:hypothetical protein ABPG77_009158 [Micractinium sp. CCAP 211/92]